MGIQELVVKAITGLVPARPSVSFVPSGYAGSSYGGPQMYPTLARVYSTSELINACVEMIATSEIGRAHV